MLIIAAPVDLVLGLVLIVATPRAFGFPLALAFEVCLAGLMPIVAAPVSVDLVLWLTLGSYPSNSYQCILNAGWFSSLEPYSYT